MRKKRRGGERRKKGGRREGQWKKERDRETEAGQGSESLDMLFNDTLPIVKKCCIIPYSL